MAAISIPCPATLLPTKADLVNIFAQLADIPSQIEVQIAQLEEKAAFNFSLEEAARKELEKQADELKSVAASVRKILDGIKNSLGNFPISVTDPIYPGLSIPDLEWERRMTALTQEYHIYVQAKMMEIINKVLPISFAIPVLGLSIDIVKIFSSPTYKASLKKQIQDNVDSFFGLVPETYKAYASKYGVDSKAIRAEITWSYLMKELQKGGLGILHKAFAGLISKFDTIWKPLRLPALPALTDLNVEGIIQGKLASLQASLENAPDDLKNAIREQMLKALDSISLAGFGIDAIVGGDIDTFVTSIEQKIERKIEALRDFGEKFPEYLIKQWMGKVLRFFEKIGLGALTEWITFNFCTFLKIVGLPSSINIGAGVDIQLTETQPPNEAQNLDSGESIPSVA